MGLKKMIHYSEVPGILKNALPQYAEMIDMSVSELGNDVVNYPLMWDMFAAVTQKFCSHPDDDSEIRCFFDTCERLLKDGDSNTQDLIVLEVVKNVRREDLAPLNVESYLGETGREALQMFGTG
jgi:hypothetical protein